MYTISVEFKPFADLHLSDLIGRIGVYVIWDARARACPTYIGEGNVLKRLTDHADRDGRRFSHPWDGYIALIDGSTRPVHKEESRALECLLLTVADQTDRLPRANAHPGNSLAVRTFCASETLRVAVRGYDPLQHPSGARPFRGSKLITVRSVPSGSYEVEHDWRLRRLGPPIL